MGRAAHGKEAELRLMLGGGDTQHSGKGRQRFVGCHCVRPNLRLRWLTHQIDPG